VLAHRGAHDDETPENTLAAFAGAVVLGADGIEFDVRRAADGELVVFHDYAIGRDALDSLSSEAIRELAGYPVPTLGDVLEWALDGVILDVELKEDGYVAEVAEQLCDFAQRGGSLIVTSFIDPVLAQLGQLAPQIRRGLLIGITGIGAVARAHECEAQTLVIQAKLASDELLDELDAAGLECLVWDLGRSGHEHARFLGDPRVVGVITDDIAWALAQRAR
jgi:glycerophosphoryl diester phosphodiesterase